MKRSRRKVIQALTSSHGGKSGRQVFCKCNQEFMCTGSSQTRTSPSQEEKKSDSVCNSQTCKSSMLRSKNAFCKRVTGKQHVTERLQTPWPFWNKPLPCLVILVFLPPAPLVQSTGSLVQGRASSLFSTRENRVGRVFCKCSPPMSIKNLCVQAAVELDENFPISKRVIAFATHGLVLTVFSLLSIICRPIIQTKSVMSAQTRILT